MELGVQHTMLGEFDKAVADFTEAIRLDPTRPESYSDGAKAYRAFGEEDQAAADEQKAKELSQ